MWINYKDEVRSISDKLLDEYLEQVDIMINNMRKRIAGTDGTYEKMIRDVVIRTNSNNTFENMYFLKNFLKDNVEKELIDTVELSMYENLLKITTIILEYYTYDIVNILKKQNLSNRQKDRVITEFLKYNSENLKKFSKEITSEYILEFAEDIENIKFSYLVKFIKNNEDFFIKYRQSDYVVGLTEEGLKKSIKEMNEFGINTTIKENISILNRLGYYSEIKEIENENKNENIIKNYISDYKLLNKMAYDNKFKLDRVSGSHGIFKNKCGKIIIIPQGRGIGKGLSFKIQGDIIDS